MMRLHPKNSSHQDERSFYHYVLGRQFRTELCEFLQQETPLQTESGKVSRRPCKSCLQLFILLMLSIVSPTYLFCLPDFPLQLDSLGVHVQA
ncbi:hypothetical protein PSACC_00142 [Paramicrosporidium saccamoebae]|uniref:Uncharacterized protein n=1 Tax=Paramicrosporidium saccamoebae TaxID=1246581 RepID=A0A2H9TQQ1_9FUNG|nr:hypothetical protein PSACC_00142 [Paramicrosporidium saccamoebae]